MKQHRYAHWLNLIEHFMYICSLIFQSHRAIGQIWGEIVRQLSDSLMIPFDVVNFANNLNMLVDELDNKHGKLLRDNGVQFGMYVFINCTLEFCN